MRANRESAGGDLRAPLESLAEFTRVGESPRVKTAGAALDRGRPADQRIAVIFETPARAPFALHVATTVAALESIMVSYPGFISYPQGL